MTIMYNQFVLWASRLKNMEFWSVFATMWYISVKPKANIFGF
jgi:hypothetical protein